MRVELTEFCQEFTTALRPLSSSLDDSIVTLNELREPDSMRSLLSVFVDIQHRLKILTDKAEQQHAYLLIFGPLKSGKSTLMNAISGAYVSEVSSLPGYPCLVYVHEGEPRRRSITRFDGSTEEFDSEEDLEKSIQLAHAELAVELRQADREQRPFNPATDYPRAIRRVDYVLPAPNLRQSGTILVDTPGLYTKMRYNYEQLTRDFRHNAACAVFVVKTDNLFYDQVFDEFKDLLGVFSRVFLVVNMDSSKQDLAPRGELRPALESSEPQRIIEAFENFTASAQLREAIGSRQLKIYLVDLLKTARRSLAGETFGLGDIEGQDAGESAPATSADEPGETAGEDPSTSVESDTPEPADDSGAGAPADQEGSASQPSAEVGFETFLRDLTRYLNSSDYIVEFMADSLRQGDNLVSEVRDEFASATLARFRSETGGLKEEADALVERLDRIEALQKTDWNGALQEAQQELDQRRREFSESELTGLRERLETHLSAWFESDESLAALVQERLQPEIETTHAKLHDRVRQLATDAFRQRNSGLKLDAQTIGHLHVLGFSIDSLYQDYEQETEAAGSSGAPAGNGVPPLDLRQDKLPVKKGFIDWILFRSPKGVRRRLFGRENPSTRHLSAGAKAKRLGTAARHFLAEKAELYMQQDLQDRDRQDLRQSVDDFGEYFQQSIRTRLAATRSEVEEREASLRTAHQARQHVLEQFETLAATSSELLAATDRLRTRFTSVATIGGGDEAAEAQEPAEYCVGQDTIVSPVESEETEGWAADNTKADRSEDPS